MPASCAETRRCAGPGICTATSERHRHPSSGAQPTTEDPHIHIHTPHQAVLRAVQHTPAQAPCRRRAHPPSTGDTSATHGWTHCSVRGSTNHLPNLLLQPPCPTTATCYHALLPPAVSAGGALTACRARHAPSCRLGRPPAAAALLLRRLRQGSSPCARRHPAAAPWP